MTSRAQDGKPEPMFDPPCPILPVKDVKAAMDYYVRVLGFRVNWETDIFAAVSRGKVILFLCQDEQGTPGTWVYIGCGDVDQLYQEYSAAGAKVHNAPQNFLWGYEVQIADPDGNVLRFGSDSKEAPLGEWLRDDGSRWLQHKDGSWTRAQP